MNRVVLLLVFFGLFASYASMTPGAIAGMGYTSEEIKAGDSMLSFLSGAARPSSGIQWSRHGPLPVILDLPFLALGKLVISEDFMLSFEPILLTALLVTIVFIWLRKLTSPGLAFLLAIGGGFGTMLWPYAYIGLETAQSFFLILAGYLALACGPICSYRRALLFGMCCGIAVSVKSTGVVLLPAILFLVYLQFRENRHARISLASIALSPIVLIWTANAIGRAHYWAALGGVFHNVRPLLIDSLFLYFTNIIGMFGSPNKGLFIFAPVLLVSAYAIPKAWRAHCRVTAFALLATGGLIAGFAFFRFFADEVWGPRYLHSCVAPLLLVIGASRKRFVLRQDFLLFLLLALGAAISFFGALYYYGVLHRAAMETWQNTAEQINGDPVLNHVRFNARLFAVWLKHSEEQVPWTPKHLWMYRRPPNLPPEKSVDLRPLSRPQALVVRLWAAARPRNLSYVYAVLWTFAGVGPVLLAGAGFLIWSGSAIRSKRVALTVRTRA